MLPGALIAGRSLGPDGLNFGKESKWFVTYVEDSSGLFYLQQSDSSISVKYERLSQDIEAAATGNKLRAFDSVPNIGVLCIAQYSEDAAWYRGQVLSVDEDGNADVIFIDYGNGEILAWNALKNITKEFTELPPQAIQCRLANIDPVGGIWSKEAIKLLRDVILERELPGIPTHLCKTGAVVIKLFADEEKSVMVAQQLVMAGFAHWKKVKSSVSQSSSSNSSSSGNALSVNAKPGSLAKFKVKIGSYFDLGISYTESLDSFYCQPVQHSESLTTMSDEMQAYYNSSQGNNHKLSSLKVEDICCARFSEDSTWYRGIISQICAGDSYEVVFVDFGNKEVLPVGEIRELALKFQQLPVLGIHAGLHGVEPAGKRTHFDDEAIQKFEDLTYDKQLVGLVNKVLDSGKVKLVLFDTTDSKDGLNINKELGNSNAVIYLEKDIGVSPMKSTSSQSASQTMVQQNFVATTLDEGETNVGYVVFATSPFDFSCQFANVSTALDNMMNELNNEYSKLKPGEMKLEMLKAGTPCCARYSEDGRFYRAELKTVKTTNALIYFVDYGNNEECRVDELKHLRKEYLKLPKQAFKCRLSDVTAPEGGCISLDGCQRFNNMVMDKEFNIRVVSIDADGIAEVSLIEKNDRNVTKFDAAEVLIEEGFVEKSKSGPKGDHGPVVSNRSYSEIDVPVGDYIDVMPTSAVSPNQFCCQLFEKYDEINEMMAELEETFKDSKPNRSVMLRNGMPCVALYPVDNVWYRAVLMHVSGQKADVSYVDYGNEETIPLDSIRPIFSKFMTLPAQAFVCSLSGIKPKGSSQWSDACTKEFSDLVTEQQLIACVKQKDQSNLHHIDLLDTMSNRKEQINIADLLIEKGFAERGEEGRSQTTMKTTERTRSAAGSSTQIQNVIVGNEEDVEITFVESPSSFFCQQVSVAAKVDTLMGNLEATYANSGPTKFKMTSPQTGMFCAAKFSEDGAWYRGKILNVGSSRLKVQYIDYGNCEDVALADVKELKEVFKNEPAYGLQCVLSGVSPKSGKWDTASVSRFKALVDYKVFNAKLQSKQPPYQMSLLENGKSVAEAMISEGFAVTASSAMKSNGYSNVELKAGAKEDVYIAHIDDMSNIYCQLTRTENELYALMDEIASNSNNLSKVSSMSQGHPVCAVFSEDNGWYRGEIIRAVDSKLATVRFVDYGNSEDVNVNSMRELTADLLKLPKFGILCSLDDGDVSWKPDAVESLRGLTADKVLKIAAKEKKNGKYIIDLYDDSGPSLASKLCSASKSPSLVASNANQSVKSKAQGFPSCKPETGVEISFYVTHVDSFGEIYIQNSSTAEQLDNLMLKLEETPRENGALRNVEIGSTCIADFSEDMAPYRAIVEKTTGSKVLVRFVDYGNPEEKHVSELRPIPDDVRNIPPFSLKCCLKNAKSSLSAKDIDKFKDLVFDKALKGRLELLKSDLHELTLQDNSITAQFCNDSQEPKRTLQSIKIDPGSCKDCYVSHTESLNEFYVQPCDIEADLDRVATLTASAANFEAMKQPAKGELCCAKFSEDGQWYRGEMKEISGAKAKVRFVDYGNSDIVEMKDVKVLAASMFEIPRLAIRCTLDVANSQQNEEIEKFTTSTLDQVLSVQFLSKDSRDFNKVKLSLNGQVLSFGKPNKNPGLRADTQTASRPQSFSAAQSPAVIIEFSDPYLSPDAEEKVYVSYVITAQEFYCQFSKDTDKLNAVMEKLEEHCGASKPLLSLSPGTPCAAKYEKDGFWYRAAIEGLESPTRVKVKFVDYGNVDTVLTTDLKELGNGFLEDPAFSVKCSLIGDVGDATDFENRVMDQELTMKVLGKNGSTYLVDLISQGESIGKKTRTQNTPSASGSLVKESSSSYKIAEIEAGSNHDAYFLEGKSPSEFRCHLVKYESDFDNLMNNIAERGSSFPCWNNILKDQPCVGIFSEDGNWYRGQILETRQEEARVKFVDYGNEEWVKNANIKKITDDLLQLPIQAVDCCLADAQPATGSWSDSEVKLFNDSCTEKMFSVTVKSANAGRFSVVLKDNSTGQIINNLFVKATKSAASVGESLESSSSAGKSFEELKLSKETKYEVLGTFVKPTGEISCQLLKFQDELGELMDDISLYCDGVAKKIDKPAAGMPCLALFSEDDSWYRGVITSVGGSVKVHFIDYGNEADVENDGIRDVRPKDLKLSVTCFDCKIPDIPVNNDVITFLEEHCLNQELSVEVKDVKSGQPAVAEVVKLETGDSIGNLVRQNFPNAQSSQRAARSTVSQDKKFGTLKIEVNTKETILCSFITSIDQVEVHILRNADEFNNMMDRIAEHCESTTEALKNPSVGQCCIAKYPVDGGWYRATVLSTSSDTIKLKYVDYGNEDEVSYADTREITNEFMKLPAASISCKLHDVHKEDLDVTAGKKWLEDACCNNEYTIKVIANEAGSQSEKGCLEVNMYYPDSEETVNDELYSKFGLEEFATEETPTSVAPSAEAQKEPAKAMSCNTEKLSFLDSDISLPSTFEAFCCYVDESLCIHCQPSESQAKLDELMVHIADFCAEDTAPVGSFQVGMACFAQFADDDGWYRAEILKVENEKCEVNFVDYGNTGMVNKNLIKAITKPYLTLPKASFACCVEGANQKHKGDAKLKSWLEERVLEQVVEVEIKEKMVDGVFKAKIVVNGQELGQLMKEELGHVVGTTDNSKEIDKSSNDVKEASSEKEKVFRTLPIVAKTLENVFCTHVDSLQQIYCQLAKYQSELCAVSDKMQTYCNESCTETAKPLVNSACLARFTEDEMWYRAQITEVMNSNVKVRFVDYGNTDVVSIANTRIASEEFMSLPITSIKCQLHDVHNDDLDIKAVVDWLRENILEQEVKLEVISDVDGTCDCILTKHGAEGTINDELYALFELAAEEPAEEIDSSSNATPSASTQSAKITSPSLKSGGKENVFCLEVDSLQHVCCQLSKYYSELESMSDKIAQYCDSSSTISDQVELGMSCLAKFTEDGIWYRAEVINVEGNEIEVHFVDYGNKDKVAKENIRMITSEFTSLPATSFICQLHDVHNEDLNVIAAVKWLQENVVDQEVNIEVVSITNDVYDCVFTKAGAESTINDELYALFELQKGEQPAENNQNANVGESMIQLSQEQQQIETHPANTVALESVSVNNAKFLPLNFEQGCKEKVYCIHVDSMQNVCCQLSKYHAELDTVSEKITAYCESSSDIPDRLEVGMACLAKFTEDGIWYRAEVINVEGNEIEVHFVDYGNKDKVAKGNTRMITSDFTSLPATSVVCQLHDVHNEDLNVIAAVKWLQENVVDQEVNIEVVSIIEGVYDCVFTKAGAESTINDELYALFELQEGEQPEEINKNTNEGESETQASQEQLQIETQPANSDTVESKSKFLPPNLELGAKERAHCIHVDTMQNVCCQLSKYHTELETLSEKIATYCECSTDIPARLAIGMACLAKFTEDSIWYRAEVINVEGNEIEVHFVDYGNKDKVAKENTRVITSEFTSLPVTSVTCQLHDIHNGDIDVDKAIEWLHQTVVDHELEVEVIGQVGDLYDCVLKKVEDNLSVNDMIHEKFELLVEKEGSEVKAETDASEELSTVAIEGDASLKLNPGVTDFVPSAKASLKSVLFKDVPTDCTILMHLSYPLSPCSFWCQFDETANELIQLMDDIRIFYSNDDLPSLEKMPSVGNFCCAKFSEDNAWYRAEVIEVCDEENCVVQFIDYGNIEKAHVSCIKELDPRFYNLEKQSIECSLYGVKPAHAEWSEDAITEFSDICAESILEVEVILKVNEMLHVLIRVTGSEATVNEIMIEKGYGSNDVTKTNGCS